MIGFLGMLDIGTYQKRPLLITSLPLGLLVLTRPDGILFALIFVLAFLLIRWRWNSDWSMSGAMLLISIPLLLLIGQMLFRALYYQDWLPNPARIKLALTGQRIHDGIRYMLDGAISQLFIWIPAAIALVALFVKTRARPHAVLLQMLLGGWGSYVVFIGGDFFPAFRHFVPLIVVAITMIVEAVRVYVPELNARGRRTSLFVSVSFALIALPGFYLVQRVHPNYLEGLTERWEWDGEVLGLLLKDAYTNKQPIIAVTAAGCIPYWSELPVIDMLGLNDRYIARHLPSTFGRGWVGHDAGDGDYVLSLRPDIIIFSAGYPQPQFHYKDDFHEGSPFHKLYSAVWFSGNVPYRDTARVWLRRDSPLIGMKLVKGVLAIPGEYFASRRQNPAQLNYKGHMMTILHPGDTLSCELPVTFPENAQIEVLGRKVGPILFEVRGKTLFLLSETGVAEVEEVHVFE
ncbi:MAG: hypothetical protein WAV84_01050 [Bacteroidota bacterium]